MEESNKERRRYEYKSVYPETMKENKCNYQTDKQGTCSKGFGKPYCKDNPNCPIKQLQLKDNELKQLNQARDEICASGQPDYIGIIRDKNIELQLKDKMIELMADCIAENTLKTSKTCRVLKEEKEPVQKRILKYYKQQALAELEE